MEQQYQPTHSMTALSIRRAETLPYEIGRVGGVRRVVGVLHMNRRVIPEPATIGMFLAVVPLTGRGVRRACT